MNHLGALRFSGNPSYLAVFTTDQLHALVSLFLALHKDGVLIAEIFWGLWLFPLGYLVIQSRFLPKLLGVVLIIGCLGYLLDGLAYFLLPAYAAAISTAVTTPAGLAELVFALWLLIKGINVARWNTRTR